MDSKDYCVPFMRAGSFDFSLFYLRVPEFRHLSRLMSFSSRARLASTENHSTALALTAQTLFARYEADLHASTMIQLQTISSSCTRLAPPRTGLSSPSPHWHLSCSQAEVPSIHSRSATDEKKKKKRLSEASRACCGHLKSASTAERLNARLTHTLSAQGGCVDWNKHSSSAFSEHYR